MVTFPLFPFARVASAQDTVTGAFEGTVRNSQTAQPIARARIEFINKQTRVSVEKLTDSQGRFFQGLLAPGTYTIRATAAGYAPGETVQRLLGMRTGDVVPVPIDLDPLAAGATPATTPTTPATGATPTTTPTTPGGARPTLTEADTNLRGSVNAKDARHGGAFTDMEVGGLPLGGTSLTRTFDELALCLPDVALPPQTLGGGSGPGVGAGVGTSGQFSANGMRSRGNNFTVDGSDNNDEDIGVRRQGFFALVPQSVESVKEYQVITLLAPAQFGRNVGAQVNAISRSGGSEHHGAAYGLFNASQLNSRNFFDTTNGNAVAPVRSGNQAVIVADTFNFNPNTLNFVPVNGRNITTRNGSGGEDSFTLGQGGFVLGGPVVARKLFYFVSLEEQKLNATKESSFAVPTVAQRGAFGSGASGIFFNRFRNQPEFGFPTTFGGDAVFSLYPFANNPQGVYGENTYTKELPANARGTILSGKLDYNFKLGERVQSFTSRYNFTQDRRQLPVTGGALFSTIEPRVRTQNLSLFLNSELSSPGAGTLLLNQLRLSYGRTRLNFGEVRDTENQIRSQQFPNVPFLLNAPVLENLTLPNFDSANNQITANTGPVFYRNTGATVEDRLGPIGQVLVAGFSPIGVDVFNFPQKRVNNTYQFADQLTVKRGNQTFTFGSDNRRTELNSILPRNFRPLLSFQGAPLLGSTGGGLAITNEFVEPVTLAAASAASGFFQSFTRGSDGGVNLRFYQLDSFVQDEWHVRSNLNLSLGLRYEFNTPFHETHNRIENTFADPALALVPGLSRFLAGRTRAYDPDTNNFSPRLGVAYAPHWFGEPGATRIRVGYGHFNDQVLGAVVSQSRNAFPTYLTVNTAGGLGNLLFPLVPLSLLNPSNQITGLVFPGTLNLLNPNTPLAQHIATINALASAGGLLAGASGVEATLPSRRQESPEAHQYSLSFEQRFGRDTSLSIAYVGTQALNLPRFSTPNLGTNAVSLIRSLSIDLQGPGRFQPQFFGIAIAPGTRIGGDSPVPGQPGGQTFIGGRPVPGVGGIQFFETTGSSRYDAMQLELRGRLHNQLQYRVGYTRSRSVDDVSDVFDLAGSSAMPQNSLTFAGERGPSNFDARHRLAYHAIYDFPDFENGTARAIFKNLQLAGSGQFQTGQPFTVNSIFDVNLDGNITDRLNTTSGIIVTGDRQQPLRLATNNLASLRAAVGKDGAVGRNTFRACNYLDMNLAVIKSFRFSETRSLIFRTEVFNFINRANFGIPVRYLEAPGFGRATSTVTPGRRVQFQLKYSF
jgi:hypothetical protein